MTSFPARLSLGTEMSILGLTPATLGYRGCKSGERQPGQGTGPTAGGSVHSCDGNFPGALTDKAAVPRDGLKT